MPLSNTKEVQAMQLPINKLRPFENHPFQVKDDDEMNQLVWSVLTQGVLTPLVVRPQSVIFCGQFIHAILFCSLLLRLLSFDFSLRIFLAQAGQYLDAPEPGTYSTPHTVQFLAGIAAHRFVGMICNSSTKPMNL